MKKYFETLEKYFESFEIYLSKEENRNSSTHK